MYLLASDIFSALTAPTLPWIRLLPVAPAFSAGAIIEIVTQGEPQEWWEGTLGGEQGWFPSSFCSSSPHGKAPVSWLH